jgi:hypothetical protein
MAWQEAKPALPVTQIFVIRFIFILISIDQTMLKETGNQISKVVHHQPSTPVGASHGRGNAPNNTKWQWSPSVDLWRPFLFISIGLSSSFTSVVLEQQT